VANTIIPMQASMHGSELTCFTPLHLISGLNEIYS